ncbi:MAG TPA: archaetidylserine decarboxylase [Methylophilaceae bacterium]
MSSHLVVSLQYLLPKQAITTLAGKFANAKAGRLTTAVISWFVKHYGVNMAEAAQPDIQQYQTFNDFFTRSLRVGVRGMAKAEFVCPVDGAVSQFGAIQVDQIFQAKGHAYSTSALVGGNQELAKYFENGSFATLYLSPKDYHRVHMPCDGHLKRMIYVPGALFSVNPATAENIPGLFARNERVICEFQSEFGLFVLVLVGATIVGSIATAWHGVVNPPRSKNVQEWQYDEQAIQLKKGQELGRFLLGSTVIILLPKQELEFNPDWAAGKSVRLGEILAKLPTA